MKQQILYAVKEKLAALGVLAQYGTGTDIAINAEFLDAKWSTGSKNIGYEAYVLIDERDRTAYMYEQTKEMGRGLSFGSSGEFSCQSGNTLFRKVKSLQYGPDGKAYEFAFDLGAIPKAVKEASLSAGWKFKTVLNRSKAMYPTRG